MYLWIISKFEFVKRKNPKERQTLILNDLPSLMASNFDPKLPNKIYAVGGDNDGTIANSTRDGKCSFKI